jgi:hypothetical protein
VQLSEPTDDFPREPSGRFKAFLDGRDRVQIISVSALALAVVVGLIVAFTAFGHHSSHSTDSEAGTFDRPTASATPDGSDVSQSDNAGSSGTAPDESITGSSPTTTAPLPVVGDIVMDQTHADAICASAVRASDGSPDSSVDLLPGGKALIVCSVDATSADGADEMQDTVVSYNLLAQKQGWTYVVPAGDDYVIGTKHLIELETTEHSATGLQDAYMSYQLTAVDLSTGHEAWSVPFETWIKPDRLNPDAQFGATEGSSGDSAHLADVVVTMTDTSAFDSATGKLLWHIPDTYDTQASGTYQDGGIVVVSGGREPDGFNDNEGGHYTGINARTGAIVWDVKAPDSFGISGADDMFYGDTVVMMGDSGYGYEVANLVTGKVLEMGRLPSGWSDVTIYPPYAVARVGHNLQLFKLSDLHRAVWSVPASSDVFIDATTPGHLLVEGPSGHLILSTADGSTTATLRDSLLSGGGLSSGGPVVVDGMLLGGDGDTVIELDPPTGH